MRVQDLFIYVHKSPTDQGGFAPLPLSPSRTQEGAWLYLVENHDVTVLITMLLSVNRAHYSYTLPLLTQSSFLY